MAKAIEETGTIQATNDKGIKIAGRWINYSKQPRGLIQQHAKGDQVILEHSEWGGAEWLESLIIAGTADPGSTAQPEQHSQPHDRDQLMIRCSALKQAIAARQIGAPTPATVGEILEIAAHLESWLSR